MSKYRRQRMQLGGLQKAANLQPVCLTLRSRESWKYARLKAYLDAKGEAHEFEYTLGSCVFDLALPSRKALVEFDGPYHSNDAQRTRDIEKELIAAENGWVVVRFTVEAGSDIDPSIFFAYI
jgi:very-short-patch-repair endonuclease